MSNEGRAQNKTDVCHRSDGHRSHYPPQQLDAQTLSVKTNALYWLTASPNISVEAGITPRWTVEVSGGLNPFTFKENTKWKHYLIQGEGRYWLCERFYGHFIGLHIGGGEFNTGHISFPWPELDKQFRYDGWNIKAGVSYGYTFILGGRWNLEATLGLGISHASYGRFSYEPCGDLIERRSRTAFVPTKAGVTFVYMIR